LKDCKDAEVPDLKDKNLGLYAFRKTWGVIGSDWDHRIIRADYDKWEREYLEDVICYKDVRDQNKFMFFCTNFDLKELIDIRPKKGSVYVKSVCEPFDIEMEIDWKRIENWIDHFGMKLQKTHVSGHASGPQLKEFVKTVSPKLVVPVHTQHAEVFDKWWDKVCLLRKVGERVEVKS
jgi:ribonuclease J